MPSRKEEKWPGRKAGSYAWFEIQDSVEYWQLMLAPKLCWQAIQYYGKYAIDDSGALLSNKAFFLPSTDPWIAAVLNSPASWYLSWRHFPHMKDEALSNDGDKISTIPIPILPSDDAGAVHDKVGRILELTRAVRRADGAMADWLLHEMGLRKLPAILSESSRLDSDAFVAAVRGALPKRAGVTPTRLAQLRGAFAETAEPAKSARATAIAEERALSEIVNRAYRLSAEDVGLMWRTAPARMPLAVTVPAGAPEPHAPDELE